LLTQLLDGKTYQEQPYLTAIDLKTGKQTPLVVLPNQPDVEMSLAPDGLALLFDQVVTATTPSNSSQINIPQQLKGEAITSSRLWLPSCPPHPLEERLPNYNQNNLPGFHPAGCREESISYTI